MKNEKIITLSGAAKKAGVSRMTIWRWMKKYTDLGEINNGIAVINPDVLDRIVEARKQLLSR